VDVDGFIGLKRALKRKKFWIGQDGWFLCYHYPK